MTGFILPLGHSEGYVRRIPWVTIAIAVVCLVVQMWATHIEMNNDPDELLEQADALYLEVIEEFGEPGRPDSVDNEETWDEFAAGELTEEDDPLYQEYLALEQRVTRFATANPIAAGGYVPATSPAWKALTSAFVHGGWLHLVGNMFFLYLVGCNIEDRWTRGGFLAFYLVGAGVATATYATLHPDSTIPLVGASGAIAAVMGAFMVVMGRSQITFFYFVWFFVRIFVGTFRAPAYIALLMYFLLQLVFVLTELSGSGGGVAFSAHVGGFAFGALVAVVLRQTGVDTKLAERGEEVVFERDGNIDRAAAMVATDPDAALVMLRPAVAASPLDPSGHQQLVHWFATLPVTPTLQREFEFHVQDEARGGRDDRLLTTYARLRTRTDFVWSDRVLLGLAQAAGRHGDNDLAVGLIRQLMREHPRSPSIPRGMWDVARIQAASGRPELAQQTRAALIERYPDDPFAQQARALSNAPDSQHS